MAPRYVLQLLFSKNPKIADNSTISKAREKYAHIWNPKILEFLGVCLMIFKTNQI
jgi:hypothetical protein